MRNKGKAKVLECTRLKACSLFTAGIKAQVISKKLKVTVRSVYRWIATFKIQGVDGIVSKNSQSYSLSLKPADLQKLQLIVSHKPKEFGYKTPSWDAPLLLHLVKTLFGVNFHPKYIYRFAMKQHISLNKRSVLQINDAHF